jgi:GT2 family glycosyltransferase/SAM-dependent methyltransferase/glycosyltransferase involved in cell wall biosynthesis
VRLGRRLGEIAGRLPLLGRLARRLRDRLRRRRLAKGSVVIPAAVRRAAIDPYLPSRSTDWPVPEAVAVAVVIPVYRGLEETRRCLESVLEHRGRVPVEVLVVDDCSPEPPISAWLDHLAARGEITLLRNASNRGFVASVNRGMREAGGRDVVLLNSDTEVPANWLERLVGHAYSGERIGSVTPFSNNATICSWPAIPGGDLPEGVSLAAIDAACHAANRGRQVEVPTAVGFCMYIRRDCLDAVGPFDEEAFGRGYGEENDFCMRALAAGWKHVLACDTFVHHVGETSFGKDSPHRAAAWDVLTRKHPEYPAAVARHVEADPAAAARLAAVAALFRAAPQPVVLLVTHALGGGTERHIRDLVAAVGESVNFLRLEPAPGGVRLSVPGLPGLPAIVLLPEAVTQVAELLGSFGIDRVHVHHWLGLGMDLRHLIDALGVPFDVTVHDFYSVCPRINLMRSPDSGYCGEPGPGDCNACIATRFDPGLTDITQWRAGTTWLLNEAERVICPSEDAKRRMARYAPHARLLAVPHEPVADRSWRVVARPLRPGERMRIGILGVVAKHKGLDALAAAASIDPRRYEFVVIGFCEPPLPRRVRRAVRETGPYRDPELGRLLDESGVHVVWFPARWPETYSYTLSAALAAGLPIIAPPLGAFPERLAGRPLTWSAEATTDKAALGRLFAEVRDALESGAADPADGPRQPTGDDFYATAYVTPPGTRDGVPRRPLRSLERDGIVSVLVLPDRRSDGRISPCGSIRLVQPFDVVAAGAADMLVEQVDGRSVFHRVADMLVCQRHAVATVAEADRLIEHCRRHGMRLVYDLDDDLLHIPADHPEAVSLRARAAVVLRLLLAADRVWVATPALANRLAGVRPDAEVVPNALDDRLWQPPPPRRADGRIGIVYMGTATHDADLAFLAPIAAALRRRYGARIRFEVVGVTTRTLPAGFERRLPDGDAANASYAGFVEWFGRQRWEIAVSPLVAGPFNGCKSAIKLMDYATLGLPIVASRHPEYAAAFGDDHGVVLVENDAAAWIDALSKLIDDPAARERAGGLARERCLARHTLSRQREFREAAIRRAAATPLEGGTRPARWRLDEAGAAGPSRSMVEAAFHAGAETPVTDLTDLDSQGDETLDHVVCGGSSAAADPRVLATKLARVLRPGGIALLVSDRPPATEGTARRDGPAAAWPPGIDPEKAAFRVEFHGEDMSARQWLTVLRKAGLHPAPPPEPVDPRVVLDIGPTVVTTAAAAPMSILKIHPGDETASHSRYPRWRGVVPLPPEGLIWSAGAPDVENFLVVADAWAQLVRRHVPPRGHVLDVGCGCGRLARVLAADPLLGGYVGFDCVAAGITWCETHVLPAFAGKPCEFHHVDARSAEYNPAGTVRSQDVRFPCGTASMDVVVAASVFTHLLEADADRYLREIARVLKPGGSALLTIRATAAPGTTYAGDESCIDVEPRHFLAMARAAGLEPRDQVDDFVGETLLVMEPLAPSPPPQPPPSTEPSREPEAMTAYEMELEAREDSFDEQGYLLANPDVAEAVRSGQLASGRQHFDRYGRHEKSGRRVRMSSRIRDAKQAKLARILPLLRRDVAALRQEAFIDCLPASVRRRRNIVDTSTVSRHDYGDAIKTIITRHAGGLVLDVGAGCRPVYYDNVVNYEIVPYDTTDVLGVAEELPFEDGVFDAVVSVAVLEHVKDPFKCAAEMVRVLKPGGDLYCEVGPRNIAAKVSPELAPALPAAIHDATCRHKAAPSKHAQMTDVFVYQMGKCASTAIVEALRSAGLTAAHTHELGADTLSNRVRTLTSGRVSSFVLEHGLGQLVQNVRLTDEILRRRDAGDCVRIITVARHPLDWFWSSLTQNFDGQKHDLLDPETIAAFEDAWARDASDEVSKLHRVIVETCVVKIDRGLQLAAGAMAHATGDSLRERLAGARQSLDERASGTARFGFQIFQPAAWFDEHIKTLTGFDVFSHPLAADGSCRLTNDWCDLLVLSYERLASLVPVISHFVQRPVSLADSNVTKGKRYAREIAEMRQLVDLPDTLTDILWGAPYCRHFGYGPGGTGA